MQFISFYFAQATVSSLRRLAVGTTCGYYVGVFEVANRPTRFQAYLHETLSMLLFGKRKAL